MRVLLELLPLRCRSMWALNGPSMAIEQADFLPLQLIRVRSDDKRDYGPVAK